ncbi:MAG: cytochrome c3 family protein, partial [Bacteroidales bacterium]
KRIASRCMKCHARIEDVHKKVIKRELWGKKSGTVPACSDCHPPHKVDIKNIEVAISDQTCVKCHQKDNLHKTTNNKTVSLKVNQSDLAASVHKNISCTKCHTDVSTHLKRPCETTGKVDCSNCHLEASNLYVESGHGKAYFNKNKNAPYCTDCHGSHVIKSRFDDTSPTYRGSIPELCGKCHRNNGKALSHTNLKELNAYSDYSLSIHGKGLKEKGLLVSAVCTDCHTTHHILKENDMRSSVNPKNIPSTCAKCHKSIFNDYVNSDHNIYKNNEKDKFPMCADCHSAHVISRIDNDKFMVEVTQQCGSCHKKLAETYSQTYHGKAYHLGYLKAARCSDCHGAHKILNVKNPNSMVGYKNIVSTCKKCHANATLAFTGYLTHATHNDNSVLFYTFWGMTSLLIGVFGFFGIHTLLWLPRSIIEARKKKLHPKFHGQINYYRRFSISQRVTHIFVILSFISLALTGMILKFSHMKWAGFLSGLLGGVHIAGNIHRFAAVVTFGYFAFHLFSLFNMKIKKRLSFKEFVFGNNSLMFNKQDVKDFVATIKWFFAKGPRPKYGRWTYWEKFDYMAVFWGVAVIGFSGLMLWFPEFFTKFFPGWLINVAQIIHSDEALLAVGFIFTIHFFNTHIRPESFPMDTVIFTGHVPLEEYKKDRPREYRELKKSGMLENVVVKKEITSSWLSFIKIFGYIFLMLGITLVVLIIYSLIAGKY